MVSCPPPGHMGTRKLNRLRMGRSIRYHGMFALDVVNTVGKYDALPSSLSSSYSASSASHKTRARVVGNSGPSAANVAAARRSSSLLSSTSQPMHSIGIAPSSGVMTQVQESISSLVQLSVRVCVSIGQLMPDRVDLSNVGYVGNWQRHPIKFRYK